MRKEKVEMLVSEQVESSRDAVCSKGKQCWTTVDESIDNVVGPDVSEYERFAPSQSAGDRQSVEACLSCF